MTTEELDRKVKEMVRLAVSHEYRRTPLRKDDIKERVLGDHSKAFPVILERAQITLKSVFGMELIEITKETKNQANRAWILRSVLDADLRVAEDIIDWSGDEALMGLTATILSLILVNNRVLNSSGFQDILMLMLTYRRSSWIPSQTQNGRLISGTAKNSSRNGNLWCHSI